MARVIKQLILLVLTGLVGTALVASPASSAPTWQPVTNLFADLSAVGGSAHTPDVEVDSHGNATVLWSRYDGTQMVVQASTRPAGGTWTAPVDIAAVNVSAGTIFDPQLAVDPAGNATAVWRTSQATSGVVQTASRAVGGTWTTPVVLSADTSVDPSEKREFPRVAVDAAGLVTATWSRYDGSSYTVQAATRQTDGTWTTPVDVSVPGQSARTPEIAVDPAGNTTVIWVSGALIQAVTRPAGGSWAAPVELSAIAGSRANPRIVVDSVGTATAVWGTFTTTYGIQTATRPLGGTWTAPVYLSAPGEDTFDTPQIAAGPQGSTTAIWQRHDGSGWIVAAATLTPGGSWSASVDLSAPDHDGWDPQVAVDPAGNATAIWSLSDGASRRIQAARRPSGGEWTAPADLSNPGSGVKNDMGIPRGDAWNPQITVDSAGNATTAWSRHDGTSWIVQARGLDAAGPVVTALTAQTGGNTGTTGRSKAYSVSAHDVWSRVASAVWRFADGTTATGTSVTHADAGTGPVKVTLTDAVGNATVCTYTGTYACRATARVSPVITRASLTRRTIRVLGSDSQAATKARIRIDLTAAAKVTLAFKQSGATKAIRLTKRLEAGRNAITIRARLVKGKTLRPGRYTITITAANKVGTSVKKKLRLRVVR